MFFQKKLLTSIKYFYTQRVFEFLYLHTERRLCYKTLFSRTRKTPVSVNCYDIFKLCNGHID